MRRTYWMSVEQLATIIAALMLASCVRVHAQFGVEQPMFAAVPPSATGSWSPTNIATIRYWWVAGDLTTNAQVTTWVDRIQNLPLTNSLGSGPTNLSTGVNFVGAQFLSPTNHFLTTPTPGSTGAVCVIFTPITPATSFGPLLTGDFNVGESGGYGIFPRSTTIITYGGSAGSGTVGTFSSGTTKDLLVNMDSGSGNTVFFTNGLQSVSTTYKGFGQHHRVGTDASINQFYKGTIWEIIWYYGAVDAAGISNLHRYATNKYSFAP